MGHIQKQLTGAMTRELKWERKMSLLRFEVVGIVVLVVSTALAQNTDHSQVDQIENNLLCDSNSSETVDNSYLPIKDYSGDFWARPNLLGDLGGKRNELAEKGITFETWVTQAFMGNARGGLSTKNGFRYSGSVDYIMELDLNRMGLIKDGSIFLHAESKWGDGIDTKVGSILPVNLDAFMPSFGMGNVTTFSQWLYEQKLCNSKLMLTFGKTAVGRYWDRNVFASDHLRQFPGLAFRMNPILGIHCPYTRMESLAKLNINDSVDYQFSVSDGLGRASRIGFDTAFQGNSLVFMNELNVKVKPSGLDGNQRFGFLYNKTDGPRIEDITWLNFDLPDIDAPGIRNKTDDWAFWYNFDQYLYTEPQDSSQGFGIFGRFGYSDGKVNPIGEFYSIGIGGKGILDGRDKDSFGVGYYYLGLSKDLPEDTKPEKGISAYYEIVVTPSILISPNLHVIVDPGGVNEDTAFAYGVRLQMYF
ncbi:MAG: carbohydrate porin [Planctomycetota bacterium]|jgi:porin